MDNLNKWSGEVIKKSADWGGYVVLYKLPTPVVVCTLEDPRDKAVQFFGDMAVNAVLIAHNGKMEWCKVLPCSRECAAYPKCAIRQAHTSASSKAGDVIITTNSPQPPAPNKWSIPKAEATQTAPKKWRISS